MKISDPRLLEDVIALKLFLSSEAYKSRSPILREKIVRLLKSRDADEVTLREAVQRIEELLLSDNPPAKLSRPRPKSEFCRILDVSLDTLNRRIASGIYRAVPVGTRSIRMPIDKLPADYDDSKSRY